MYCRPDDDAQYAESHDIDLSEVEPFVAKYPNPDDVVSVSEQEGMKLDGCFIGACTTAEEVSFDNLMPLTSLRGRTSADQLPLADRTLCWVRWFWSRHSMMESSP